MMLGTTQAKERKITLPPAIEIPCVPEQSCEVGRCGVVKSRKCPPRRHDFREKSPLQGERNATEVRSGPMSLENWLQCILVAKFDIDYGPVVETVVPSNSLETSTQRLIALIALPDSHACFFGDSFFTFAIRDNQSIPLNSCATMEHSYLHAFVLYRQEKNAKLRRGALQRSIVLVSHHYFPNVFYRLAKQLGPLYFENDAGVINAAWGDVAQWPAPQRDGIYVLPFAGSTLHAMIPKLFDSPSSSVGPHVSTVPGLNDGKAAEDAEQTTAGLWSSLPGLSEELWHLWEILLTGSPLVVYSESVCELSRAIEALRLLISPLRYFGDVRPYLTHYDPDFGELCRLSREFDTQRGLRSPIRLSFGVTGKFGHGHGCGEGNSRSKGIPLESSYRGRRSRRQVRAIEDAKNMIGKCEGGKEETGEDEDPIRTADKVSDSSRDRANAGPTSCENELEALASGSVPRAMDEKGSDTRTLSMHVSGTCSDRASLKENNGYVGDSCHRGVLLGITSAHVLQTLRFLPNGLFLGRVPRQTPVPDTEISSDHENSTEFRLSKDRGITSEEAARDRRPEEPISKVQNRDVASQRPTELPGPQNRNSLVQCPGNEMIMDSTTRESKCARSTASLDSPRGPAGGAVHSFPFSPRSFFSSSFVSSLLSPRASSERTTPQMSAISTPHPSLSIFSFSPSASSPGSSSRTRVRLRSGGPLGPGNLMEVTKSRSDSVLATRAAPCIAADCSVLRRLLSATPKPANSCNSAPLGICCKEHPTHGCQHRDNTDAQANTFVEAAEFHASQVNDEILRRYFVTLTCTFLQPFERYFRMESTCAGTVRGTSMSSNYGYGNTGNEKRKGPEDDLSTCAGAGGVARRVSVDHLGQNPYINSTNLLPSFSPTCFLEEIRFEKLPPPPFTRCGGPEGLYARFIRSPNFRPWFAERRRQALGEINVLTKGLRMATTEATLLVDRNGRRKSERRLVQLLAQVKQAIITERQRRTPDDELVLHMQKHQTALEKALPQDVLTAVKVADQGLQTVAQT